MAKKKNLKVSPEKEEKLRRLFKDGLDEAAKNPEAAWGKERDRDKQPNAPPKQEEASPPIALRCRQCKNHLLQKSGGRTRVRTQGPLVFDADGVCRTKCYWCGAPVAVPIEIRKA